MLRALIFLMLLMALPARAGTTTSFAGGAVGGCTLQGKVYSCSGLPLSEWNDAMVIARNYTVKVSGNVYFGYNQGLSMDANSGLAATGNLNIGDIATSLLQVNGASFSAGGQFSMGAQQQTIAADITAASMQLGTGSQTRITGTINSSGPVAIASNVTITGSISGTAVSTNSPVSITGNVTASRSFTLASGSTMAGNIKSDVVQLLASGVRVTGSIEAATSLQLGSGNTVNGSVVTGELTLDDSSSAIFGNATVDHATLGWATRVTDTITCARGSTPGKCDCVTNNSGYEVRSVKTSGNGPYCTGKAQPLDHFLISHPATGGVCSTSSVTVTACANAACTASYGGGASVYLQPGAQAVTIGASGTASVAAQLPPGTPTLSLTSSASGGAQAVSCRLSGSGAASDCKVQMSDTSLGLAVGDDNGFYAGDDNSQVDLRVTAQLYDDAAKRCLPLFQSVKRRILFTYAYDNPASGSAQPRVNSQPLTTGGTPLQLDFDANGVANAKLSYADAGAVKISARVDETVSNASGSFVALVAPASFKVELLGLPAARKAGSSFGARVTALNRAGAVTANFGREAQPVIVQLAGTVCQPVKGANGFVAPNATQPPSVSKGVEEFSNTLKMNEVGSIDVVASLANYLGAKLTPTGTSNTNTGGCTGASGLFVPAWFKVAKTAGERKTAAGIEQYYSDERTLALTVSAMNIGGAVTQNYAGVLARNVGLVAADPARKPLASQPGNFQSSGACSQTLCAGDFTLGVASWTGGYVFDKSPSAPATIRIRATESTGKPLDTPASSQDATLDTDEPLILVRSGRARIANNYIGAGKELALPVSVEYWDGKNWMRNIDDSTAVFPATAFSLTTASATDALNASKIAAGVKIVKGAGELRLQPPAAAAGVVNVALNLGTSDTQDTSCIAAKKNTKGAAQPYLRALDTACTAAVRDPSARATFGVFTPETRRIIHVRESFR